MTSNYQQKYLADSDIAIRYGVSRQTIWRWNRETRYNRGKGNDFPKPVILGGSTRWLISELEAWEEQQIKVSNDGE